MPQLDKHYQQARMYYNDGRFRKLILTTRILLNKQLKELFFPSWNVSEMKHVRTLLKRNYSSSKDTSISLSHVDSEGKANMVGVGNKPESFRTAKAQVTVLLGEKAFKLVEANQIKKGDVLTVAQTAGILAAKQTSSLIPLCHPIPITKVDVSCELNHSMCAVIITSAVETTWKTGVEMEALCAASVAALTVYDMCKAVTHNILIKDLMLLSKSGGTRNYQKEL